MEAGPSNSTRPVAEKEDSEEHEVEHQLLPPRHRGSREYSNGLSCSSSSILGIDEKCHQDTTSKQETMSKQPSPHPEAEQHPFQTNAAISRQSSTPSEPSTVPSVTGNLPNPTLAPYTAPPVPPFPFFPGVVPTQFPMASMPFVPFYNPAFIPMNPQMPPQFLMTLADCYRMNPQWRQSPTLSTTPSQPAPSQSPTRELSHDSSVEAKTPRESSEEPEQSYSLEGIPHFRATPPSSTSSTRKGKTRETQPHTSSATGTIFVNEDGRPITFFVQTEMNNRQSIINKIRKHGGLMKVTQEEADYSILYLGSKACKPLLKEAAASKAIAINTSFINDCVDEGTLLDYTPYLLQSPTRRRISNVSMPKTSSVTPSSPSSKPPSFQKDTKLRVAQSPDRHGLSPVARKPVIFQTQDYQHSSASTKEKKPLLQQAQRTGLSPRAKKGQERSVPPQQAVRTNRPPLNSKGSSSKPVNQVKSAQPTAPAGVRDERPHKKTVDNRKTSSSHTVVPPRERSPTPPPAPTLYQTKGRGFEYTEAEKDYVRRYCQVLFSRDHEITVMNIARKLHEKMPHHTQGSWNTYIGTNATMRADIDALRKRAGILFRKQRHVQAVQENGANSVVVQVKKEDTGDEPARPFKKRRTDESQPDLNPREKDFEVIVDFFQRWNSSGRGSEEEDDDTVWATLTSEATCETHASWKDFYEEHHVEVNARYESRMA